MRMRARRPAPRPPGVLARARTSAPRAIRGDSFRMWVRRSPGSCCSLAFEFAFHFGVGRLRSFAGQREEHLVEACLTEGEVADRDPQVRELAECLRRACAGLLAPGGGGDPGGEARRVPL